MTPLYRSRARVYIKQPENNSISINQLGNKIVTKEQYWSQCDTLSSVPIGKQNPWKTFNSIQRKGERECCRKIYTNCLFFSILFNLKMNVIYIIRHWIVGIVYYRTGLYSVVVSSVGVRDFIEWKIRLIWIVKMLI